MGWTMNNHDYAQMVEELVSSAAREIVASRHDSAAMAVAMKNYLQRGRKKSLSLGELVDFFGISSDSVLHRAGLAEDESMSLMRLFGEMCDGMVIEGG